ncbi:hypothetical protein [Terrisporobacter muris]|jgi:hypothetical protein|uniref:Uncharacterized protein n=1 Tax=Terrisporobacter muris TaxID=2963284 RepID=A0A9X2S0H7_9FIRM|nr:hypothetical protein [Terrisporobacter muris]MCR1822013.1 hypothetical protein [Terrisporobacter muris]
MKLNQDDTKKLLEILYKGLEIIKKEENTGDIKEKLKWLNSINLKIEILGYYVDTDSKDVTMLDISEYLDTVISDLEENKFNDYIYNTLFNDLEILLNE